MKVIRNIYKKMKQKFRERCIRRANHSPFIIAESVYATPMTAEEKARLQEKINELD